MAISSILSVDLKTYNDIFIHLLTKGKVSTTIIFCEFGLYSQLSLMHF